MPVAVDDEQLLDAVLVQERLASSTLTPGRHGDELLRHQRADGLVEVLLEADVARGEDADRALALDDGDAADVVLAHDLERRAQRLRRPGRDRAEDHPALGALDALDLARLRLDGQVLVEDADAALARHRDGGAASVTESIAALSERDVQLEPAAEPGLHVDVLRQHLAVGGHEEDVVERQALAELVVEHASAPRMSARGARRLRAASADSPRATAALVRDFRALGRLLLAERRRARR